jgi:hypothetical protein
MLVGRLKGVTLTDVAVGDHHTICWGYGRGLAVCYSFGRNAGQLGLPVSGKDAAHWIPRKVPYISTDRSVVVHLVTTDGATVCLTVSGDALIFKDYVCRTLQMPRTRFPRMFTVFTPEPKWQYEQVAALQTRTGQEVFALRTTSGHLFVWANNQMNPVVWKGVSRRSFRLLDVCIEQGGAETDNIAVVVVGVDRLVYTAALKLSKLPQHEGDCISLHPHRVRCLYLASSYFDRERPLNQL